jgi:lysophospholipase L1-like esterase
MSALQIKKITKAILVLFAVFSGIGTAVGQTTKAKLNLNIVFIGNSITYGANLSDPATQAPPVIACEYLKKQPGIGKVDYSNQGHSGFTTVDFLPSTGKPFNNVEEAAVDFTDAKAQLVFSIKLGTNDSAIDGPNGAPVSPANYEQNLKAIADSLLKEFPASIIIFQRPIWYSPNTYNSAKYLQQGLARLQSYFPKLDELVKAYSVSHPNHVFLGDQQGFVYFKKHYLTDLTPENGKQGKFYLHPNAQGAVALGNLWAEAIYKVVSARNQ